MCFRAEAGEVARIPIQFAGRTAKDKLARAVRATLDVLAKVRLALDVYHSTCRQFDDNLRLRRMVVG